MTCKSCKGTRRIELAFSVVECLDCQPASLPAAPMAKCTDGNVVLLWDGFAGGRDEMPATRCFRGLFNRTPEPGHVYEWNNNSDMWIYKDTI